MKAFKAILFILTVTVLGACGGKSGGKKASLRNGGRAQMAKVDCGTAPAAADKKTMCEALIQLQASQENAQCSIEWSKQIAQNKCEEVVPVPPAVTAQSQENPIVARQADTQPDTDVQLVQNTVQNAVQQDENSEPVGDGQFHFRMNRNMPATATTGTVTAVPAAAPAAAPAPRIVPAPQIVQTNRTVTPQQPQLVAEVPQRVAPPQSSGTTTVTAGELLSNTGAYLRGGVSGGVSGRTTTNQQTQTQLTRVERTQGSDGSLTISVQPATTETVPPQAVVDLTNVQLLEVQEGRVASEADFGTACAPVEKINAEARTINWGNDIASPVFKDNLTGWADAVCRLGLQRQKNKKLWATIHSYLGGRSWFKTATAQESCRNELANYAIACSQAVRDGFKSQVFNAAK